MSDRTLVGTRPIVVAFTPEQRAAYEQGTDEAIMRARTFDFDAFMDHPCPCTGKECLCDYGPIPR